MKFVSFFINNSLLCLCRRSESQKKNTAEERRASLERKKVEFIILKEHSKQTEIHFHFSEDDLKV